MGAALNAEPVRAASCIGARVVRQGRACPTPHITQALCDEGDFFFSFSILQSLIIRCFPTDDVSPWSQPLNLNSTGALKTIHCGAQPGGAHQHGKESSWICPASFYRRPPLCVPGACVLPSFLPSFLLPSFLSPAALITYHDHYAFQTRHKLYFVLDYCPGGELFTHIGRSKRLTEK